MAPIDLKRLTDALEVHGQAYRLLLWLGEHARIEPELLSQESEAALIDPARCREWLETHVPELPVAHTDFIGSASLAHMLRDLASSR